MVAKEPQVADSVEDPFVAALLAAREVGDALAEKRVIDKGTALRGATEGPLQHLTPIYVDFESTVTPDITLRKQTLRQYLSAADLESASIVLGDTDTPMSYFTDVIPGLPDTANMLDSQVVAALHTLVSDPNYVWVSHNAAFDVRVARLKLGLPQPKNVWCTMEGAMGAWPELPGGYSLDNCSRRLGLAHNDRKFKLNLIELNRVRNKILKSGKDLHFSAVAEDVVEEFTRILKLRKLELPEMISLETCAIVLDIYNCQDVISMREIYMRQIARTPACEQETALRTHQQRRFYFEIDQARIDSLVATMDKNAQYAEQLAQEYVTDEQAKDIFNRESDDGSLRSVRYQRLRNVINDLRDDDEEFESTSLKKLSPIQLAKNPTVNAILEQTSRAGKMISHKRKAAVFHGVDRVDCELGYMRAHTGRFSSPSVGKGLNLHNIPKHDKAIAKPIRQCFSLPDDMCLVRADLANVEYRIEGMLTGCKSVRDMFDAERGGSIFNDPYCLSWNTMTGMNITSTSPIRQVAKSAVLGLGFCMSPIGYARVILGVLAGKKVTEESLGEIIRENGWKSPPGKVTEKIIKFLGCSHTVASAAFHIHRTFNSAHREFGETAQWLVNAIEAVSVAPNNTVEGRDIAKRRLDRVYAHTSAPSRDMLNLTIDDDPLPQYPCVRVQCGPWAPTVCWREPHSRPTDFSGGPQNYRLTILKANGFYKSFTRQLAIENVTQAAARNAMCLGLDKLDKLGFPDAIHIHDEIMLVVPKNREIVLKARDAMLNVFGPGHGLPHKWAILVKPEEISVTQSMYEDGDDIDPEKGDRWGRIERNEENCLAALP